MSKKKQKSDIIIDARGAEGNARLADYCRNLPRDQWDYTIMAIEKSELLYTKMMLRSALPFSRG